MSIWSSAAPSALLLCFSVSVICPFFCFSFLGFASSPPPLSIASLIQPPLINFNSSSSLSTLSSPLPSQIKQKCASPLNRLLLYALSASSCAPPPFSTNYPFAGWTFTSSTSSSAASAEHKEFHNKCFDRSEKCANFAKLCRDSLYHLFLHSHCALTCGFCKNVTVGRRGIGDGVRAPTKNWRNGEEDGRWNGKKKSEIVGKTAKPTQKVPKSTEQIIGATTEAVTNKTEKEENWYKMGTTTITGQSTEEEKEEEKCEDEGRNCAAMERMCGVSAQKTDIMGTFCRKTCKLC